MRLDLPTWYDWYNALETACAQAFKMSGIKGTRGLTGADDVLNVKITDTSNSLTSMPYLRIWLIDHEWDNVKNDYHSKNYTSRAGTMITKPKSFRETITFSLILYSTQYKQLLEMSQALSAYFLKVGELIDGDYNAQYVFGDYALDIREADNGDISYYSAGWQMQLSIDSSVLASDTTTPTTNTIIIQRDDEIGSSLDDENPNTGIDTIEIT
jgi:hypothetical protein